MYNAYIITELGKTYSDKGLYDMKTMLKEDYGITDEILFHQGQDYNNPSLLSRLLNNDRNSAVILSVENGVYAITDPIEHENVTLVLLRNHPDQTSWKTLTDAVLASIKK